MTLKPFVNISGRGPALVLLHGWGLHGGIWETILPQLEENFTVYNIDLPGFGRSAVHNGEYTLEYLVDSVASILPETCYLMGWSLGGMVATALTLKHPNLISKLIIVCANPSFISRDEWEYGMKMNTLESFINYLEEDYEGTLIRFLGIQTMGSATQKEDIKKLKETVFMHGQPSKKALRGGLEIFQDINLAPQLKQIEIPVLSFYGKLDSLVSFKAAEEIVKYIPQVKSIIYDQSAHAPFLSSSENFINDINNFLLQELSEGKN